MREHAIGTAEAFSAMKPEYIGLLTLMVEPGTPLEKWVREGSFTVLGPEDILRETELLLQHIDSEGSVFRMNHASNYLTLKGTLNQDRDAMLERVRKGLEGYGLRSTCVLCERCEQRTVKYYYFTEEAALRGGFLCTQAAPACGRNVFPCCLFAGNLL